MSRKERDKGARWERQLANDLHATWNDARRGIGQARSGGDVPDVDGTPFWIEAKHRKRQPALAALQQATDATDGRPPVAIIKIDREQPFVAMWLSDWLEIVRNHE